MPETNTERESIITIKILIDPTLRNAFIAWQSKLNAYIADFPGFISLEILSPSTNQWMITEQFRDKAAARAWQNHSLNIDLLKELSQFQYRKERCLEITESSADTLKGGITEVFVTQVKPDKTESFKKWIEKVHLEQTKFPGFIGAYLQAPNQNQGKNWITFLQFDTRENLDNWLTSSVRQHLLLELDNVVESLDTHRVSSPYAGWFTSAVSGMSSPAVWKQTMIVLLVLFPVVMLEMKFLSPLLQNYMNLTLLTFIGNAVSVTLLAWPLVPATIKMLDWWLNPKRENSSKIDMQGTLIVLGIYLIEIILLWHLF